MERNQEFKRAVADRVRDYLARERISREQFAFRTKLGKSTIDKFLVGLYSDKTLSTVAQETGLDLSGAIHVPALAPQGDAFDVLPPPVFDGPDTPAGKVDISYRQEGRFVEEVRLTNVPAFLYAEGLTAEVEGLGEIVVDVAYGGNFYAIVEPQKNFRDMAEHTAGELLGWSPKLRAALNAKYEFVHPEHPQINGLSHIQWTGKPAQAGAHARNAVFYGDKAIDRSPCGTGTSARMAQLAARGDLKPGDEFVHESIIGSLFRGRVEAAVKVAGRDAIVPSVAGWARMTGYNTIFIDDRDPFAHGFVVK